MTTQSSSASPEVLSIAESPLLRMARSLLSSSLMRMTRPANPLPRITRITTPLIRMTRPSYPLPRISRFSTPLVRMSRSSMSPPLVRMSRSSVSYPIVRMTRFFATHPDADLKKNVLLKDNYNWLNKLPFL